MLPSPPTGPNVPNVTWTRSTRWSSTCCWSRCSAGACTRHSGWYASAFAVGAVALGGVLPMAVLTHWAGRADHGGLALDLTADALVLGGIVVALTSRSRVARWGRPSPGSPRSSSSWRTRGRPTRGKGA